ncbi:hypothetical protein [Streptomyces sp. NEAU-H3]|uniref:hypothetical protein n=1 Tax=Streptomyces sp. NEAU-H3 TaxID=2720636 RepID=UPI00143C5112|nr:hypothetical protein [Streptomyces sp. NEAU-H3]NJA56663.1 hypothetical protein [Streptomyces sp. NEAU-H3]
MSTPTASYLTAAGLSLSDRALRVDVVEGIGTFFHTDGRDLPTATIAHCRACGTKDISNWFAETWDENKQQFVRWQEHDADSVSEYACTWARKHASQCSAIQPAS